MATIDKTREEQFIRYAGIHLRGASESIVSAITVCAPFSERAKELTEIRSDVMDLVSKLEKLT